MPTIAEPSAQEEVRITEAISSVPSLRRSRNAPITAPAMKPKPLAAASRITTEEVLTAIIGVTSESTTFVAVMPAMINVGVHASSRA